MRVLVCGGRDFDDWELFHTSMSKICGHSCPTIIEGGAKGADFLARVWAKLYNLEYEEYPANWKKYGKGAGHIRNKQMLDEGKPDIVIAFPGGYGTLNMIKQSTRAGIKVVEVKNDELV